ncbi:hypothetical protein BA3_0001 [Thalassomonas phage BA3]|uniref:hypothetical protein n=1 Tax=Thalassomonas phage BA3 TaxID=469660 RepID=UPI00015D9586|nr:hypothetical protein BA3_0001 [Thalassomonas phage BA3]ABV74286.1 hypothetical protein BA3_0001 [Thalassomonas phage BA3]
MAVAMIGPKFYAWDRNGKPLAFGKLYTYEARTNVPKDTYKSEDQITPNTNPVILNGEGYADVYLDGSYKMVLKDDKDNEIWSSDPVTANQAQEWINCFAATYISSTSFRLSGNQTDRYTQDRRVRIDNGTTEYAYSTIVSSSYAAGETSVTIKDAVITTGLNSTCTSVVSDKSSFNGVDSGSYSGFVFKTVDDMKAGITLRDGEVDLFRNAKATTLGYYEEGDGGGAEYLIVQGGSGTDDGGQFHDLNNGNQAKLLPKEIHSVGVFGVYLDASITSTVEMQAAIDSGLNIIVPFGATVISRSLVAKSGMRLTIDGLLKSSPSIGSFPLISGDSIDDMIISGKGIIDGNKGNVGSVDSPGIKITNITNSSVQDITIKDCFIATDPGINGCGLWFEGGSDCFAYNVKAINNTGNGIVFGNMNDSYTANCVGSNNLNGSGIAHTRGLRAKSLNDYANGNTFSNITVNCVDSQITDPISIGSGFAGINIGHDNEASDASRTVLRGGVTRDNNFEGVTIAGSTEVSVIGTNISNNGSNGGANDRHGIRLLNNSFRCSFIDVLVTESKNSGISVESGSVKIIKTYFL